MPPLKGGFPVWMAEDGKKIAYEVPQLVGDLFRLNADAAARGRGVRIVEAGRG